MFCAVAELAAGNAAFAGTTACTVLAAVVGTALGYAGVLTAMPGIVAPVANMGTVPANEPFTGAAALVPLGTAAGLPITATLLPGCAKLAADAGMPLFGTVTPLPNTATLPGIVAPADGTVAAAAGAVALGTVTPLPNTATLPPAAATGDATVPFETNAAGKVPLPNGVATVLFGTVTPLPNTATLAAGAVFGTAVATVPDALCAGTVPAAPLATVEGTGVLTGCAELTEDTLPGGNVGLAGCETAVLIPEETPVDGMPSEEEISLPARSMMPSPLKSAATTFLLSALIWERSIATGRLGRDAGCA